MNRDEAGDILVVDDHPDNLDLLAGILRPQGYRVRWANGGKRGIRVAEAHPPDLLLLDIMMPDLNGYDVCRRLKANAETAHLPIIFLSALDDMPDKIKAFQAGGVDYITKP
ncbi:MAG: response regulator, partial [Acidobacteriota bacterium]